MRQPPHPFRLHPLTGLERCSGFDLSSATGLRFCRSVAAEGLDAEEVADDVEVDVAFEIGEPAEVELGGIDPAVAAEFGILGLQIDERIRPVELAAEVDLLLSYVSPAAA